MARRMADALNDPFVQTGSQIAGIKMGDLRTDEGAAQMVERLLGRMKPGREIRRQQNAGS